jgi:hypothetical protein
VAAQHDWLSVDGQIAVLLVGAVDEFQVPPSLGLPTPYAALIGRALPYQVHDTTPKHRILSRQEVEEELKLRGLPTELLAVLRATPAPLDPGEIENPYDIELPPDGSAGTPK